MVYITEGLVDGVAMWVLVDDGGDVRMMHRSWWRLNAMAQRHGLTVETVH